MKLLQALREKIYEEQAKIADLFAKAVGFNGIHDTNTVIERKNAEHAWKFIVQNKQLLIDSFPKENIKKLSLLPSIDKDTDLGDILTIFKQILRSQKARLISRKRYDWNVEQRRQSYSLEYRIISATPNKPPPQPTPALSTPQIPNTDNTKKDMPNTQTSDTKVSTTVEQLPQAVTMSAKRKLSPTPEDAQQPEEKKQKLPTPQKQEQTTPDEKVSDIRVLNASPTPTAPPNSPRVEHTATPSPTQTLSPTPKGALAPAQVPVPVE